jgi:hypothetical protein
MGRDEISIHRGLAVSKLTTNSSLVGRWIGRASRVSSPDTSLGGKYGQSLRELPFQISRRRLAETAVDWSQLGRKQFKQPIKFLMGVGIRGVSLLLNCHHL